MIAGRISERAETPPALSAVISFSDARRLNAYSTATSTDIGSVIASVNGIDSRKNSVIICHESPRPTRSPNRRAMYWSSRSDVSADRANTNGPICSFRTYRLIIFTRQSGLVVRPRNFKRFTGLYGRVRPVYSTRRPPEFKPVIPRARGPRTGFFPRGE